MRPFLLGLLAVGTALSASSVFASAEDNTLTILQRGEGNALFVDQSKASGSAVKGLELGTGTEVTTGLRIKLTNEARQLGGNNTADVVVTGNNGAVYLYQNNTSGGAPNTATINALNGGSGLVAQNGFNNEANLTVNGLNPRALFRGDPRIDGGIIQNGDGNRASVVSGFDTNARLVQNGDSNEGVLDISGSAAGSSVVYTQNGSNLTSATAAQVFTTAVGGTVSVTQTGFGSVTTRGAVSVTQTAR